ncbi:MAG TPA: HlyD family efflux transporter periplasmic adaptor subunit [Gammaproteobacteria bacterium]|nr:HlyD family efflux transporter periplasmic adaptor subunit [Gammaproteobacteria bacterium]
MKKMIKVILLMIMVICLYTCAHRHTRSTKTNEIMAVAQPVNSVLYYSSIIEPINTVPVTSPADGIIHSIAFHFGDAVKKGQPLFLISSDKFQADYKTALMQYIKAKTDYAVDQNQLRESEFLHKNHLISDDDYQAKKTGFYNARLSMVQAKEALDHLQEQMDIHPSGFDDLKIEDIDKITRVLHAENQLRDIRVLSDAEGVILLPNKEEGSNELKKIHKGDAVRQGDVIAVIGDPGGLMLHLDVDEMSVNQLYPGQPVRVTGTAFPDDMLSGKITAINRQGESMQGGLPLFAVEVVVPTLSLEERHRIHIGMTAKVAILMDRSTKVTVPIKAIVERDGKTWASLKDEKTGTVHPVLVKTGETTLDSVVIESGLTSGDKIVFSD